MLDHTRLLNSDSKIINETSLNNNQSDDDDSEIEFDNSKVIRNPTNNSTSVNSNSSDRKR